MNILIVNKNKQYLVNNNYNVMKQIEGEYFSKEIISLVSNLTYDKLIIDLTAVKNYHDIASIRELTANIESDKIIMLLSNEIITLSTYYISSLVNLGIYNFTVIPAEIAMLINNPRDYKKAKEISNIGYSNIINNMSNYNNSNVNNSNVNNNNINNNNINNNIINTNKKVSVFGFKNITASAGSTTLIYMLKNSLEQVYKKNVVALELNKSDFKYLNITNGFSITKEELSSYIFKFNNYDFILVDINESNSEMLCDQVFYLIEPSLVKINKLISKDRTIISSLNGKNVILNKSTLNDNYIKNFEYETKLKIWCVIPPLNERENNPIINKISENLIKYANKNN